VAPGIHPQYHPVGALAEEARGVRDFPEPGRSQTREGALLELGPLSPRERVRPSWKIIFFLGGVLLTPGGRGQQDRTEAGRTPGRSCGESREWPGPSAPGFPLGGRVRAPNSGLPVCPALQETNYPGREGEGGGMGVIVPRKMGEGPSPFFLGAEESFKQVRCPLPGGAFAPPPGSPSPRVV